MALAVLRGLSPWLAVLSSGLAASAREVQDSLNREDHGMRSDRERSWHGDLASRIDRLRARGVTRGKIEIRIPEKSLPVFLNHIYRSNLLAFCGASPGSLLFLSCRWDGHAAYATFALRDRPGSDDTVSAYPPVEAMLG
jgi:hypothetical protein